VVCAVWGDLAVRVSGGTQSGTSLSLSHVAGFVVYCRLARTSHRPISRTVWLKVPMQI
jgi:hypothetical protein